MISNRAGGVAVVVDKEAVEDETCSNSERGGSILLCSLVARSPLSGGASFWSCTGVSNASSSSIASASCAVSS